MGLKINTRNALSYGGIFLICIVVVTLSVFSILFLSTISRATTLSWAGSADPTVSWSQIIPAGTNRLGCQSETNIPRATESPLSQACVFHGSALRFIADYMSYVSFGDEAKFYTTYGIGSSDGIHGPTLFPGTDTMYIRNSLSYDKSYLALYKDFASRFIKRQGEPSYNWNGNNPDFELKDETGAYIPIWMAGHSENGKWIAVEALERGIILINIETEQATLISKYRGYYGLGANPNMQFRVSNDGKHVAIAGWNVGLKIIDVTDGCGDTPTTAVLTAGTMPHPCPERYLDTIVQASTPSGVDKRWITEPQFNSDATELSVLVGQPDAGLMHLATLIAPGITPSQRLDYLALGDSYSSGEGDVEINPATNTSYYLPGTDNGPQNELPEERCHISTRSYPFLLRNDFNIPLNKMKSVACSGAKVEDLRANNGAYLGQRNILENLSASSLLSKRAEALDDFIPGRLEQIDFVEKMKPKVVTLTISGNDVGFVPILESCASIQSVLTCSYAQNTVERAMLGRSINNQFSAITQRINAIKAVSPNTKVYVLSYPKFIYAGTAMCGLNVGILDSDERALIDQSIEYLNEVISAAANATGVKFIDIENALEGGQMCQSNPRYVTGLDAVGWTNSAAYGWTFHPNAGGHRKMTDAIKQQLGTANTLLTYPYDQQQNSNISAPVPTSYFATSINNYNKNTRATHLTNNIIVTKGQSINISVEKYKFKRGSTAYVTAHSDPVDLVDITVNNDGSLNSQVTIPTSLPVGYHTLIISGETYTGEAIDYHQMILVKSANSNDVDENGVIDSQQPCGPFIAPSGQDADFDGKDDACDPEVTDPILYVARNGDLDKREDPTKLYLYRNTLASSVTGVMDDYVDTSIDPTNTEAFIASTNVLQGGVTFNKFVMLEDESNPGIRIPTIFAKDQNGQCVSFQPQDYISPALNPMSSAYQPRELTKLIQLPEGVDCE